MTAAPEPQDLSAPRVLCVDSVGLAVMLNISPRSVRRQDELGRIPAPIELGGSKRWVIEEIQAWLRAGAPRRQQWNSMRRSVA